MLCTILGLLPLLCYGKDIILNPFIGDSTEIALSNGKYVWDTIQNADPGDSIILNNSEPTYYIPFDIVTNVYNITIKLNSDIYLHDNSSAWTLYQNTDSYINAFDIRNSSYITIEGNGDSVVDGQGYQWWLDFFKGKISRQRPTMLYLENCINVFISDIIFLDSPRFHIYAKNILRMEIADVTIWVDADLSIFPFNTDGIDVSGKDIYIHDCMISNYDDAVCIKPADYSTPDLDNTNMSCTENIVVDNVYVYKGVGLSVGSVASTKQHCIRNVMFQNIVADEPIKFIYIKTGNIHEATSIQGHITNITYKNMVATDALLWPIYIGPQQQKEPDGTGDGVWPPVNPFVEIRDIFLENISIHMKTHYSKYGVLRCDLNNPCSNFQFKEVTVKGGQKKYICSENGSLLGYYDNNTKPPLKKCGLKLI